MTNSSSFWVQQQHTAAAPHPTHSYSTAGASEGPWDATQPVCVFLTAMQHCVSCCPCPPWLPSPLCFSLFQNMEVFQLHKYGLKKKCMYHITISFKIFTLLSGMKILFIVWCNACCSFVINVLYNFLVLRLWLTHQKKESWVKQVDRYHIILRWVESETAFSYCLRFLATCME